MRWRSEIGAHGWTKFVQMSVTRGMPTVADVAVEDEAEVEAEEQVLTRAGRPEAETQGGEDGEGYVCRGDVTVSDLD